MLEQMLMLKSFLIIRNKKSQPNLTARIHEETVIWPR